MQTLRNKLIAVLVLGILAVIGTMMNSRRAAAQGPPNGLAVRIVNPLPVPVLGNLGITGTVPVTGSVSISGNSASNPLVVRDVSKSPSAVVELSCTISVTCIGINANGENTGPFTVPAGTTLLITSVDIHNFNSSIGIVGLEELLASPPTRFVRESWTVGTGHNTVQFQYPTGIAVAAGHQLMTANSADAGNIFVMIHGYLIAN